MSMSRIEHIHTHSTILRWGAIFGGGLLALATFAVLSSLWGALATSGGGFFADTISWWLVGTGIFAMFIGGLLAGWMSGRRGIVAGLMNGLTVWALFGLLSTVGLLPAGLADATAFEFGAGDVLWIQFWSLLIGLGSAAVGGVIGGAIPQPTDDAELHQPYPVRERVVDVRDHDRDRQAAHTNL